ncbi:MAG: mechanosensitive ion channel family protein [Clostridiales bacterium]|nr:mechanosensitive ion channel family protein [Clostridiales bacterium]
MKEFLEQQAAEMGLGGFAVIIDILYKIGLCIVSVAVGLLILKFLTGLLKKALNKNISKRETILTVCSSVLKYFVYLCIFCQILLIFGISPASIIAVAGVGSVALGLGAQDLVGDIISGTFILIEDQFQVGDTVKIEGYQGTVESIGLKTTKLRNYNGDVYIIPNGEIKIVTNSCKEFSRAVLEISVSYDHDPQFVMDILSDELEKAFEESDPEGMTAMPEVLGITDLGDSAVVIRIITDCEAGSQWAVERKLRLRIKKRFDRENIVIPYPQRVVYVKEEKEEAGKNGA